MSRIGSAGRGTRGGFPSATSPFINDLIGAFGQFQQSQQLSPAQQEALQEQVGLRDEVNKAFQTFGTGARNQLIDQFGTESKNVQADFQGRGLAGSSLAGVAQVDLEAQKQSAIGDLESQIRAGQSQALQGVANNFSGILTNAAGQSGQLLSTLLSSLSQQLPQPGGGEALKGGGGGGGGGSVNTDAGQETGLLGQAKKQGKLHCVGLPVGAFIKCMRG